LGQNTAIRTLLPYNDGSKFDFSVTVTGNAYSIKANPGGGEMIEYLSGSDDNLPDLASGHYGVYSWAQKEDKNAESNPIKPRGTLVESITVSSTELDKTTMFADLIPTDWRPLTMLDSQGQTRSDGFIHGNFRLDFRDGTIQDDSNSFKYATTSSTAGMGVDFLGAAVVVDEDGNADWTDYDMMVRIAARDDEGPGVLVRVQDDDTFYRVNFATQGGSASRPGKGMSIQKCKDGVWSELFSENDDPQFLYTQDGLGDGTEIPFDLKVRVIGDTITVQVINDPDGAATVINYDPVVDDTDPILSGSVGLTNWGAGDLNEGLVYSPYGGQAGASLVTAIPEPSMLILLSLLGVGSLAARRR
jgi:hypothetical protein